MSACEEACDHLFEAATLSAQLVQAETQRDDYKRAWQRDLEKGREFLAERDAFKAALDVAKGALTIASVSDDPAATNDRCGVCGEPPDFCDRTAAHYGEATACVGHVARAALSRISTLVDPPGGKR